MAFVIEFECTGSLVLTETRLPANRILDHDCHTAPGPIPIRNRTVVPKKHEGKPVSVVTLRVTGIHHAERDDYIAGVITRSVITTSWDSSRRA